MEFGPATELYAIANYVTTSPTDAVVTAPVRQSQAGPGPAVVSLGGGGPQF